MEAMIARLIQILIALGGAYLLTLWFALVIWTFQDIQARSRSVVAQIFSTLVVLIFSLPGLLVYMILRPRYTLDDAFQRSLEEEYLMQDLQELPLCPTCQHYVEDEWVFCPSCRTELRDNCISCRKLIDLNWEICPYCGTEQPVDDLEQAPQPLEQPFERFLAPPKRPQVSPVSIRELRDEDQDQRTRQIIPATVRVDLRSGDVATESWRSLHAPNAGPELTELASPRRVSLGGNGIHAYQGEKPDGTGEVETPRSEGADTSSGANPTPDMAGVANSETESDDASGDRNAGESTHRTSSDVASGERWEPPSATSNGSDRKRRPLLQPRRAKKKSRRTRSSGSPD